MTHNYNNICMNCNKPNHHVNQCKLPVISYGVIAVRPSECGIQYLMICRKHTFGFIDFVRGNYSCYNTQQIQKYIDEMTLDEKRRILTEPFNKLWGDLCGTNFMGGRDDEYIASKKFNSLLSDESLATLVANSPTGWNDPEWEFPKGRRNCQERDLDCALREFKEETGYDISSISVIENVIPYEEIFIGSNHKSYKYKYYLAYMKETDVVENMQQYQSSEVSKMEWKTLNDCLSSIRPYNLEKKTIVQNINMILQEYRLYL